MAAKVPTSGRTSTATGSGGRPAAARTCLPRHSFFFFFQAEDGIRDIGVTGVQTCALPIVAFERAYTTVAERIGDSRGYVREELLRDAAGLRYHIFAEWESEDDFVQWVEDPVHMVAGAPLARWHSVEFRREVLEIRRRPDEDEEFPQLASPGGDVEVERVRVDSAVVVEPGAGPGVPGAL